MLRLVHKRLDAALAMVEEAFGRTTLAEVLAEPTESVPLCNFPVAQPAVPAATKQA